MPNVVMSETVTDSCRNRQALFVKSLWNSVSPGATRDALEPERHVPTCSGNLLFMHDPGHAALAVGLRRHGLPVVIREFDLGHQNGDSPHSRHWRCSQDSESQPSGS